ncbi:CinA family protein [Rhizohabitans arisaemae]|uniref:CinA family protein n=1 Tax=Rhizohabitans arisaemae TaxID=2720610 RepID=UPI0024B1DC91|nr:nicotinamide-nucleotide amidohydrolase family protein [Rhizohabitans arisaemae]
MDLSVLAARGQTLAVAESLTGGLLGAAITAVPGASAFFRGGVIAYATELKAELLGVPRELLARHGAVHPEVAAAMARGVCRLTGASWGLSTTGVAGPDLQDGQPVGRVFVGLCAPGGAESARRFALVGSREEIRNSTVIHAMSLLQAAIGEHKG